MLQDTGLHYDRYLREVIEYLEKDPHFKEKLKHTNMEDIKVATTVFRKPCIDRNTCADLWRVAYMLTER